MLEPRREAVGAAERAVARLAEGYELRLQAQVRQLERLLAAEAWVEATRVAHDLAGEAGTLGWPLISAAARSLRSVLEQPAGAGRVAAASLHVASMRLMVAEGYKGDHPAGRRLVGELAHLSMWLR